jgi:hypothetical protein
MLADHRFEKPEKIQILVPVMPGIHLFSFSSRLLLGFMLLAFTWYPFASQEPQAQCSQINLTFSLTAGQSLKQNIGAGLTLQVHSNDSLGPPNGWTFSLDDPARHDYIAPVNPPLRFNPLQTLGPGHGLTARESWSVVVTIAGFHSSKSSTGNPQCDNIDRMVSSLQSSSESGIILRVRLIQRLTIVWMTVEALVSLIAA